MDFEEDHDLWGWDGEWIPSDPDDNDDAPAWGQESPMETLGGR